MLSAAAFVFLRADIPVEVIPEERAPDAGERFLSRLLGDGDAGMFSSRPHCFRWGDPPDNALCTMSLSTCEHARKVFRGKYTSTDEQCDLNVAPMFCVGFYSKLEKSPERRVYCTLSEWKCTNSLVKGYKGNKVWRTDSVCVATTSIGGQ